MRRKDWPRKSGLSLGLGAGVGGGGIAYLLNDSFLTDDAAPMTSPAPAEPGPGTRTVTDGSNFMSITGGRLLIAQGAGNDDPRITYASTPVSYTQGKIFLSKFYIDNINTKVAFGLDASNPVLQNFSAGVYLVGVTFKYYIDGANPAIQFGDWAINTNTNVAIIRGLGRNYIFSKTSGHWYLLYAFPTSLTGNLYPGISDYATAALNSYIDFIRIPTMLWTPKPIFADDFGGTWPTSNGGGLTGLEAGGSGKTWQVGPAVSTWSISGGTLVNAATAGSNVVVNGTFDADTDWTKGLGWDIGVTTAGVATKAVDIVSWIYQTNLTTYLWYRCKFDLKSRTAGSIRVGFGSTNTSALYSTTADNIICTGKAVSTRNGFLPTTDFRGGVDNLYYYPLTTNTLFTGYSDSVTDDVYIKAKLTTVATGFQAGVFLNMDSLSNPQNFDLIYLNMNDGKIYWDSCVAGVYTNKKTSVGTYAAGSELHVRRIGTDLYVWYGNAYVFNDTSSQPANTNYIHGVFSTGSIAAEVAIDDFYIYPSGSEGEFSILDIFIN